MSSLISHFSAANNQTSPSTVGTHNNKKSSIQPYCKADTRCQGLLLPYTSCANMFKSSTESPNLTLPATSHSGTTYTYGPKCHRGLAAQTCICTEHTPGTKTTIATALTHTDQSSLQTCKAHTQQGKSVTKAWLQRVAKRKLQNQKCGIQHIGILAHCCYTRSCTENPDKMCPLCNTCA
jgi:L-asparaginase II